MDEIRFYRAVGKYAFLSNLYRRPVVFPDHFAEFGEGFTPTREFRSSEDAYQYGKPRRAEVANWIVSAPTPHLCALAAHALFVYDVRADWQAVKIDRMRAVLEAKFGQHDDLRALLITTGDADLVEESRMDAFWGIGTKGNGKNMLGVLLMELRGRLRGRPLG